jgi:hypothetical protein
MLLPLSVADGRLPQVTMTSEWTSTIDDSDGDLNTTTTANFSVTPNTPPRVAGHHQPGRARCHRHVSFLSAAERTNMVYNGLTFAVFSR